MRSALVPLFLVCAAICLPRPLTAEIQSCAIVLTRESPEFLNGRAGYLKALTELANSHRRGFIRKGGGRKFLLELAELLPEDVRAQGRELVIQQKILDFDADNADMNLKPAIRLLSAFRGICVAWNYSNDAKAAQYQIPLDTLYTLEGAMAAVERMGLDQKLTQNDARPDIDLFQDRTFGGLSELQYWANWSQIAFARNAREALTRLLAGIPASATVEDRARIAREVSEIGNFDGDNGFRQPDAARRILTAWTSISSYYSIPGAHPHTKEGTRRLLIAMRAQILLASELQWFRRPDGGMTYLRDFIREQVGGFGSGFTLRDFLITLCRERLPQREAEEAVAAIGAIEWRLNDGETAFRRIGGMKASERIFQAIGVIARAWNKAYGEDPNRRIDLSRLHSSTELYRALTLMGYVIAAPPAPSEVPPERFVVAATRGDEPKANVSPSSKLTEISPLLEKLSKTPAKSIGRLETVLRNIAEKFDHDAHSDVLTALLEQFHDLARTSAGKAGVQAARESILDTIFEIGQLDCPVFRAALEEALVHEESSIRYIAVNAVDRLHIEDPKIIAQMRSMVTTDKAVGGRAGMVLGGRR